MAPLAIAQALATELARDAADPASVSPVADAQAVPPGLRQSPLRGRAPSSGPSARSSPPRPPGAGSRLSTPRRVNVEFVSANPTGPLTVGNARGAFVGDLLCRVLEAGRPGGESRVLLQRLRDARSTNLGASVLAIRAGDDDPRGRLSRRLRRATSPARSRRTCSPPPRRRRTRPRWSAAGPPNASGPASRRRSPGSGSQFDIWKTERSLHDEGWVERAVERLRAGGHVYELDGALWFRSTTFGDDKDRVIIRADGRPDLLRGRHRLRHREVQPRLRPPHLHLGRRPPRDGGPGAQRGRGDGLRQGGRRDDPHRLGALRARRGRGLDVQAGRRVHLARRPAGRDRRRRRALVLRRARPHDGDRPGHRAGQEAVVGQPGLLRPVRPRPDRLDPAQGRRRTSWPRPRASRGR